jgi:hypothetical protein
MALVEFIKKRKHLVWYAKNYDKLSAEAVVEAIFNYDNWDDVQQLIKILGMKRVAKIFHEKSKPDKFGRQNYRNRAKNFFYSLP